jgi:cyclopropane fatty-acyl-phospholipid synthase-like methyltransferase
MSVDRKSHWENVFKTKSPNEVSWTQEIPQTSLDLINSCGVEKSAKIIDIGGGDSNLVDYLIEEGYINVSVLDISEQALENAKLRLGDNAKNVTWIVSDIIDFKPKEIYDIWHDRAAFHFLTDQNQINSYFEVATKFVRNFMIIGTFSTDGPKKCSGLDITQYDESKMEEVFSKGFDKVKCKIEDHQTPFQTMQNFIFCLFRKKI